MKPVFREVTAVYDTKYGAFTGTILALQSSSLSLITGDGLYPLKLENGRAIRMVNVPLKRINVNGKVLMVGMDHEYRLNIPASIELAGETFEISSAPSLESRLDVIDRDINNVASIINTINDVLNDDIAPRINRISRKLSSLATEKTLSEILATLTPPNEIRSKKVTIDNSKGTDTVVKPLFTSPTNSKHALIRRDQSDTGIIYIGDPVNQEFPLLPGDTISIHATDLSSVFVKVPVGIVANIYVLWEVYSVVSISPPPISLA